LRPWTGETRVQSALHFGGAIFMKIHSMASSCLWYNFFANGHR